MSITFGSKTRVADVMSSLEPSIKYQGKSWFDTSTNTLKFWNANTQTWVTSEQLQTVILNEGFSVGNRGVFNGGNGGLTVLDYINIDTISNAINFGANTISKTSFSGTSNGSNDRGIFGGGYSAINVIEYITIMIQSNALDYGDLTIGRHGQGGLSNNINNRGVFAGGSDGGTFFNVIDYVNISTTNNALDFGDLTTTKVYCASASNGINNKGLTSGGHVSSNVIDYFMLSVLGNSVDYGDLTLGRHGVASTSNHINNRAIIVGGTTTGDGSSTVNVIDYMTISTQSNALDFGDLYTNRGFHLSSTSNGINNRGVNGGSWNPSVTTNIIDYVNISVLSNSTDFGDLTVSRGQPGSTSNA